MTCPFDSPGCGGPAALYFDQPFCPECWWLAPMDAHAVYHTEISPNRTFGVTEQEEQKDSTTRATRGLTATWASQT